MHLKIPLSWCNVNIKFNINSLLFHTKLSRDNFFLHTNHFQIDKTAVIDQQQKKVNKTINLFSFFHVLFHRRRQFSFVYNVNWFVPFFVY